MTATEELLDNVADPFSGELLKTRQHLLTSARTFLENVV